MVAPSPILRAFKFLMIMGLFVTSLLLGSNLTAQKPPEVAPITDSGQGQSGEVAMLKAELDITRQYDERLLSTVYWSLATIAAIAVLLTGYSWFTNFRVYERDRQSLRDEMHTSMQQEWSITKLHLEEALKKRIDRLSVDQKDAWKSANDDIERQEKKSAAALITAESGLKREIALVNFELVRLSIKMAKANDEPKSTILRKYLGLFEVALDIEFEWVYVDAMKQIEDLMRQGATLGANDVSTLHDLLNRVAPQFRSQAEVIRQLIPSAIDRF